MAEQLGKIEKPEAEKFSKGKKLFFVPLIFSPPEPEGEFDEKIRKYWEEVESHITNLESRLGSINRIFHELVPVGGEQGGKVIEELNSASYQILNSRIERGAEVQPIEDADLLTEFMDWSRCLAVGLQNPAVLTKVYESYTEVRSKRNTDMAKKLDESLKENEIGILLMREGHQVQFPSDIDVFYVAPPALDEIKRWFRTRDEEDQAQSEKESKE